MSLKEIPSSHFRIAVNDTLEKLRVCSSVGQLLDEISDLESTHGKSLTKLGVQPLISGKIEWLPAYYSVWDNVHKICTTMNGKQHMNLSQNVTQNMSKTYPEYAKSHKKRLNAISVKVMALVDELKKSKVVHHKNIEKYLRLVQETETTLRNRDAANDAPDVQNRNNGERDSVCGGALHVAPKEDSGFMNRSLTKMLSKIAPAEKRLEDKCKDLLRELEVSEGSIVANTRRLNACRAELVAELGRALGEVEEVERGRAIAMKDGLSRFYIAQDLLIEKQFEADATVSAQIGSVSSAEEMAALLKEVNDRCVAICSISKKKEVPAHVEEESPDGATSDSEGALPSDFAELFAQTEKLGEAMEFFKLLSVRATNSLLEIADTERGYGKTAVRILEKHGFSALLANTESSSTGVAVARSTAPASSSATCCEMLGQIESPSLRDGWRQFVKSFCLLADVHTRSAEVFSEEVCQRLDLVQKRIEIGRRELMDKLASNSKRYAAAASNVEKLSAKLTKLQSFLKERKSTLKLAKDAIAQESGTSGGTQSAGAIPSISELEKDLESEGEEHAVAVPADKKERKNSVKMMQGLESLGSSLRKSKLKQVVGLESPENRVARIENQVVSSEEEERDLSEALKASLAVSSTVNVAVKAELTAALNNAKELLRSDLDTMQDAARVLVTWLSESVTLSRSANLAIRTAHDEINIANDLLHYVMSVSNAADSFSENDNHEGVANSVTQLLLEVPPVEVFEPLHSEIIDEERRTSHTQSSPVPVPGSGFQALVQATVTSHARETADAEVPLSSAQEREEATKAEGRTATETAVEAIPAAEAVADSLTDSVADSVAGSLETESHSVDVVAEKESTASAVRLEAQDSEEKTQTVASPTEISVLSFVSQEVTSDVNPEPLSAVHGDPVQEQQPVNPAPEHPSKMALAVPEEVCPSPPSTSVSGSVSPACASPDGSAQRSSSVSEEVSMLSLPPPMMSSPSVTHPLSGLSSPSSVKLDGHTGSELSKFGLSAQDKVLESFSCALYPKKGLLTHGRMFITQHFLAFSGWPDTRVLLALSNIRSVEKSNTLGYIPNALSVTTSDGQEFFFGSFIERTQCLTLLTSLSEIARRIIAIQGEDFVADPRPLEFGYQSRNNLFGSGTAAVTAPPPAAAVPTNSNGISLFGASATGDGGESAVGSPSARLFTSEIELVAHDSSKQSVRLQHQVREVEEYISDRRSSKSSNNNITRIPSVSGADFIPVPVSISTRPQRVPVKQDTFSADVADGINLSTLFAQKNITPMMDRTFDAPAPDVWKSCFLHGSGYGDFLLSEGDLNIEYGEWQPLGRPVPEDVSKVPFTYSRPFAYAHPRTTMLMFGPKNAPATQVQYLYLPSDMGSETISTVRPRRGLIVNITQFDGIPMADVFKVMQYWVFEASPSDPTKTVVRVGLAMHYIKSSLFKSQIFGGTRDELTDQLKKWFPFADKLIAKYQASRAVDGEEQDVFEDFEVTETLFADGTRHLSRSSSEVGLTSANEFRRRNSNASPSVASVRRLSMGRDVLLQQQVVNANSIAADKPRIDFRLYWAAIIVLSLLLLGQWWHNRVLSSQIASLNSKFDANQQSTLEHIQNSQLLVQQLLAQQKAT